LPSVIDGAGLRVISAERRESAHMPLSPKKRTTRKVRAESANVFAVRVQDIRFGITYCLSSIVDFAAKGVVPIIRSSESGDGERESVEVYRHAPFYELPRFQQPVLGLSQPVIIDAHGTAEKPILESTQIFNVIPNLRDRIAEAPQNNRRNPRYPEIP